MSARFFLKKYFIILLIAKSITLLAASDYQKALELCKQYYNTTRVSVKRYIYHYKPYDGVWASCSGNCSTCNDFLKDVNTTPYWTNTDGGDHRNISKNYTEGSIPKENYCYFFEHFVDHYSCKRCWSNDTNYTAPQNWQPRPDLYYLNSCSAEQTGSIEQCSDRDGTVFSKTTNCCKETICFVPKCDRNDTAFPPLADNEQIIDLWNEPDDHSSQCLEQNATVQQRFASCKKQYRCVLRTDQCPIERDEPINSYVSPHNESFHEDIAINGVEFTLHYASTDLNDTEIAPGWDLSIDARLFGERLHLGSGHIYAVTPVVENGYKVVTLGTREWFFDANGTLDHIRNTYTKETRYHFSYDESGRLIEITDSDGQSTFIKRDDNGTVTAIVAPQGQRTMLAIDEKGDLIEVQYEDGSSYAFEYERHLMTRETDPNGNAFEHVYNATGKIVKVIDAEQGEWDFATRYGTDAVERSITRAAGDTVLYQNHLLKNGLLTYTKILPSGETITYTDALDESNATVTRCGMRTLSLYRKNGDGTLYKDPYTRRRELSQRRRTTPSGLSYVEYFHTEYLYNPGGTRLLKRITTHTTPLGTSTATTNYKRHRITMVSPMGRRSHIQYDDRMQKVRHSKPWAHYKTSYRYDDKGRVIEEKTGRRITRYRYDDLGNLAAVTDPIGRETRYSYDLLGRITEIVYPDGSTERFAYDANGNLLKRTVPTPADHTFAYNGVNKPTDYTDPLSRSTTYSYDKQRRVTKITKPSGKEIAYRYNGGELQRITTPEGATDYTYACAGNPASITRGSERIDYRYDGTLLTEDKRSGTLNQSITYSYNDAFLPASVTYAGKTTPLAYNNDAQLIQSGDFSLGYWKKKGLQVEVSDGSYTLRRHFNRYGELNRLADDILHLRLLRNKAGQIIKKIETLHGKRTVYHYRYDSRGRLIEVKKRRKVVESYSYDANGNRQSATVYGKRYEGHYTLDDALTVYGDNTYRYDDDGYLIEKTTPQGTTAYTYNTQGALTDVTLPDNTTIRYILDPLNRRIAKEVNGTITEKYLWQDLTTLLAVYDKDDNLIQRFEYADGRMPVAMTDGSGERYYLHNDQVGSLRAVSNAGGDIIKEIAYDSFGNVLLDSNPGFKVPFGFAGGLYDSDTGLIHFGYREYDPFTGKWTAKDPLLFGGGDSNLYGYVLGDPVSGFDPSGKVAVVDDIVIIGGLAILGGLSIYEAQQSHIGQAIENWWYGPHWWDFPDNTSNDKPYCEARKSKKEKATDAPSWAKQLGKRPSPKQKCQDFAKQLLDTKYGQGNWRKGAGTEYNKIVKWCQRSLK